ncbi:MULTISPECIES: flavodoxin family protein [Citrobacter]|uniref:flavodoxin family protein n=1 Tax=Citrobacter TaxID=544 RepID=UPI000E3C3F7E|nr:flavodoxin/nitric oxide synthase [Citrobacter gillenii]MBD0826559.1 flavodoxin/nitric oxide synthase [Citrobacter sp. C1]RFU93287.1 flavodoxin/nitric oxide synthase [Citrobacter gillenii]
MNWKKNILIGASLMVIAGAVIGIAAFSVMTLKDRTYVPSPVFEPVGEPNQKVAVVYYSRSGHSEAVAREVARMFNAPIAKIESDYALDLVGQQKAISDANNKVLPRIVVEPIDLHRVRRIFLISPTWMFRPATPLWSYVEQTDFSGKEVVLITTGNSRFKQTETDAFEERVVAHGGHFIRHIFLLRGRIYWQKSREELLQEISVQMSNYPRLLDP